MNNIVSSYTGFQPLKEVWLGNTYPPCFYEHLDSQTQDIFNKITELTYTDLSNLEKKIQEFGIVVQRPVFDCVDHYLDDNDNLIKPPICPRDWALTLGDTLYITHQYPNGDSPFGHSIDLYRKNKQSVKMLDRSVDDCDLMKWLIFPSTVRVGKDLYIDYPLGNGTIKKYNELVIEELAKTYRVHVTTTGDHSDGTFCPVSAGHIFSTHYKQKYNDTFPGWEVFFLTDTTQQRKTNGNNNNWWLPGNDYELITNSLLLEYAKTWLGDSRETVFEVNMLIIDDKNVICIAEDDTACKKLESIGITPHVIDFKTRGFWDGGIHCLTVDIHRTGNKVDYWPNRGPSGIYRY